MAKKQIATFLGPNKGLSIVGSHCAAYSGDFASDAGNQTTYLKFQTGAEYIVGTCQFHYGQSGQDDDYDYTIKFNGITICNYTTTGGREVGEPDYPIPLVVPPFTEVEMTCQNISTSTGRRHNVIFVGRVHNA